MILHGRSAAAYADRSLVGLYEPRGPRGRASAATRQWCRFSDVEHPPHHPVRGQPEGHLAESKSRSRAPAKDHGGPGAQKKTPRRRAVMTTTRSAYSAQTQTPEA